MVRYRFNKRGEPSWKRGHSRIFTTISRFARRERFKRFCLLETVLRSVLFRFENSVSARTKRVSSWALCIRWKFLLGIRVTSKEHFGYFWGTSGLIGFNDCDIIRQRHWILIGRKMIYIFHISFFFFVFYCFFSLSLFRYELDYDLNERIIN